MVAGEEVIHIGQDELLRDLPARDPILEHGPEENEAVGLAFAFGLAGAGA